MYFSGGVCLWASPHPVPKLSPFEYTIFRYISRILNVRDLYFLYCYLATLICPIYQDIVRLDIGMNNSFAMEGRDPTKGISENPLS